MQLMEIVSADPDGADGGRRTKATHPYSYDPFTMWRGPDEPDGSVYTDRLFRWDPRKHDELCMKHFGDREQYWNRRDTDKIQAFLRDYLNAPDLVLCEVQEHCDQATGYPCWYFAYRKTPKVLLNEPQKPGPDMLCAPGPAAQPEREGLPGFRG